MSCKNLRSLELAMFVMNLAIVFPVFASLLSSIIQIGGCGIFGS